MVTSFIEFSLQTQSSQLSQNPWQSEHFPTQLYFLLEHCFQFSGLFQGQQQSLREMTQDYRKWFYHRGMNSPSMFTPNSQWIGPIYSLSTYWIIKARDNCGMLNDDHQQFRLAAVRGKKKIQATLKENIGLLESEEDPVGPVETVYRQYGQVN